MNPKYVCSVFSTNYGQPYKNDICLVEMVGLFRLFQVIYTYITSCKVLKLIIFSKLSLTILNEMFAVYHIVNNFNRYYKYYNWRLLN